MAANRELILHYVPIVPLLETSLTVDSCELNMLAIQLLGTLYQQVAEGSGDNMFPDGATFIINNFLKPFNAVMVSVAPLNYTEFNST